MDFIFANHFPKQNIAIPIYYKVSSFTYTLAGLYLNIKSKILFQYLDFPWIFFSHLLIMVGILSYISDTHYLCKPNKVVIFDKMFAITCFILNIYLLINQTNLSWYFNLFGIMSACCCKIKGAIYFNIKQYDIYFIYHTLWHVFLPLFTFMSINHINN